MLILTRRILETIFIGNNDDIEITILGINVGTVRLGIKAAPDIPIIRSELKRAKNNKHRFESQN